MRMENEYILRMAIPSDCLKINNLLTKYHVENLPSGSLDQGYISIRFSDEQILEMIDFPGVIVACDHANEIIATACLSTLKEDIWHQSEFANALFSAIQTSSYGGKQLIGYKVAMYGPVCVDEKFSGRGIAQMLFDLARQTLGLRGFDFGLLFIDQQNARSMHVHLHKLSVKPIDTFKVGEKSYALGLFPTRP